MSADTKRQEALNRLEDIEWLIVDQGEGVASICGRPGMPPTPGALHRFLYRRHRGDLVCRIGLGSRAVYREMARAS